jgi:hypothetical protein
MQLKKYIHLCIKDKCQLRLLWIKSVQIFGAIVYVTLAIEPHSRDYDAWL